MSHCKGYEVLYWYFFSAGDKEQQMINSYEYFMENRNECEEDLIVLHLMEETLEVDDDIFNNQLPF